MIRRNAASVQPLSSSTATVDVGGMHNEEMTTAKNTKKKRGGRKQSKKRNAKTTKAYILLGSLFLFLAVSFVAIVSWTLRYRSDSPLASKISNNLLRRRRYYGAHRHQEPRRVPEERERNLHSDRTTDDDDDDNGGDDETKTEQLQLQQNQQRFVPPNSIYNSKLKLDDIHGYSVDMSKYFGMVSLVVNVACL